MLIINSSTAVFDTWWKEPLCRYQVREVVMYSARGRNSNFSPLILCWVAHTLKHEVWLPLSNLCAGAEHFINSHNLICLQYKSYLVIILLRAIADLKSEHFQTVRCISELFKGFFFKTLSIWLFFSPGNFECGNPENLKSKCVWVSDAKDHVVVSRLWTAIVMT